MTKNPVNTQHYRDSILYGRFHRYPCIFTVNVVDYNQKLVHHCQFCPLGMFSECTNFSLFQYTSIYNVQYL